MSSQIIADRSSIPSTTEALLVDCDGTIADTMAFHHQAWIECLRPYGVTLDVELLEEYSGVPTVEIMADLRKRFQLNFCVETLSKERDRLASELLVDVEVIRPVLEILDYYSDTLPMAVISGGTKSHVEDTLIQVGLFERFRLILTADSPFPAKPNPDLFLEAARYLEVTPANCIVLEDGEAGLIAAERAGMKAIDVRQLPGYDVRSLGK